MTVISPPSTTQRWPHPLPTCLKQLSVRSLTKRTVVCSSWDRYRPQKTADPLVSRPALHSRPLSCHRHCKASDNQNDDSGPTSSPRQPPQFPLVPTSVAFYAAMTALGCALGKESDVLSQLTASPLLMEDALKYLAVMMAFFCVSTALAEVVPSFKQLKDLYQRTLIPQLKQASLLGLAALAAGAGIGEETLFRAWFQTWITHYAEYVPGAPPGTAQFAGIAVASVVFGATHAATPAYFWFATAAGAVFGVEYVMSGLPAAAFTHAVYDFIAFVAILQLWGKAPLLPPPPASPK